MMITAFSRASGLCAIRASATRALVLSNPSPLKASHYGQTRSIRFGLWSSYLNTEFQRLFQRHRRTIKCNYMDSINLKSASDLNSHAKDSRAVTKKMMARYWIRHGSARSTVRCVREDDVWSGSNDALGNRPDLNFEGVGDSAINSLFTDKRAGLPESDLWQISPRNICSYLGSQTRNKSTASASRDGHSEIDPITNRRIHSSHTSHSVFDDSSDKDVQEPFFPDGVPPADELREYGNVTIDNTPWADTGSTNRDADVPQYADLDKYKPVMDKKLDAPRPLEKSKYNDLEKYKPVGLDDMLVDSGSEHKYANLTLSGRAPGDMVHTADRNFDQYRRVVRDINAQTPAVQELYSDLGKYGPVMHNEKDELEEMQTYYDLHKYGPSSFNEPEGLRPRTAEEKSKDYDDLHKYGPQAFNEPSGSPPMHPEEASKAYTDLGKYGPVVWNEPHGQAPVHPKWANKAYTDLDAYNPVGWNEPDGQPPMHPEAASKQYKDLRTYSKEFDRNGAPPPEGVIAAVEPGDAAKHRPVQYDEPESQRPKPNWDQTSLDEAKNYQSYRYNEPDGQPLEAIIDPVSKGLSDFDEKVVLKGNSRSAYTQMTEQERADDLDLLRASDIRAKMATSSGQSRREYSTTNRKLLEPDFPRYEVDWDMTSRGAPVTQRNSRIKLGDQIMVKTEKEGLAGNHVGGFSEDVSRSRNATGSVMGSQAESQAEQDNKRRSAGQDEIFSKLQPALDRSSAFRSGRRTGKESLSDCYSKEPKGLELSYSEECGGRQTWPAYVCSYGTATDASKEKTVSSTAGQDVGGPTIYRILAFDPTMQAISTAETTSVVPDSTAPLTPADVLLRLSNPSKFFPYFGALHREGYEIVSGSGDVLVFRKVREAETTTSTGQPASSSAPMREKSTTTYQAPKVNPIDMMGSDPVVPSAYSSSPTGYLNYDYPGAETTEKPPPPIGPPRRRSTSTSDDRSDFGSQQAKRSRAKNIVLGAAWVGGISYALGLLGEYFATSDSDR